MSWDQSYSVPSVESLLVQLTKKTPRELLEEELKKQNLSIEKTESILLADGMFDDIHGDRVYLSDGRIFEPKLVRRETADGNYGNDVYEYYLKDDVVDVESVDLSAPVMEEQEYYSSGESGFCHNNSDGSNDCGC